MPQWTQIRPWKRSQRGWDTLYITGGDWNQWNFMTFYSVGNVIMTYYDIPDWRSPWIFQMGRAQPPTRSWLWNATCLPLRPRKDGYACCSTSLNGGELGATRSHATWNHLGEITYRCLAHHPWCGLLYSAVDDSFNYPAIEFKWNILQHRLELFCEVKMSILRFNWGDQFRDFSNFLGQEGIWDNWSAETLGGCGSIARQRRLWFQHVSKQMVLVFHVLNEDSSMLIAIDLLIPFVYLKLVGGGSDTNQPQGLAVLGIVG